MKVKLKGHNGAMALVVSGTRQELIITEEDGCLIIEMVADTAHEAPIPAAVPGPMVDVGQEPVPEEGQDTDTPPPSGESLFKRLVLLRKTLANADKVAPYLVFHDKTLHEMVDKMPADMQAMGHISGVGLAKLEKYGPAFLEAINGVAV